MRTRRGMVGGLLVVAALLLSGCTEVVSLVNKANIDVGLQNLTATLEVIPSVTTVTATAKITPEFNYTVEVRVTVDELVEPDLLEVVAAVTETFASDVFVATEALIFGLSSANGAQLALSQPLTVPADELRQDIQYWIGISVVYATPLSMEVAPGSRVIAAYNDVTQEPDWAVLRAVPDDSSVSKQWYLGGFSFSEEFPPDSVLRLRTALRALAVGDEESVEVWNYHPGYIEVSFFPAEPRAIDEPADSVAWPRVSQALQLIADAHIALANFVYYYESTSDSSTFAPNNVHLGVCATEVRKAPGDDALWEALAASNPQLPDGSGAGYCDPA